MSHVAYTTFAYVLASRSIGEANKLFTLLTRDFGTITATAQSIRLEKSKLRFALQKFSFAEISLVRGRGGWRITNAYPLENIFFNQESSKQKIVINITKLLRRLLVGESPDEKLFDLVLRGFSILSGLSEKENSAFELVLVVKILRTLGYGSESNVLEKIGNESIETESLREFSALRRTAIVKEINAALGASGL